MLMCPAHQATIHCLEEFRARWNTTVLARMKAMTITSHPEIQSARSWRSTPHCRVSSFTAAKTRRLSPARAIRVH